ncbi:hypothetical protein BA768_07355 [Chryseobacterium sp. CBo1]|nr:hypothetical protein BA768_07355 [Chryseobacterium sp. CBo1]
MGYSQGENDHWYFGYKAAVNFSSAVPIALNNSQMFSAIEACGTASDANGKLLFYTDGSIIWNRDHEIMNGGGLGLSGDWSSQQLAIVKHPGNQNQYYIFTTGLNNPTSNSKIAYTVIDMSLGSSGLDGLPLGKIVDNLRNVPVKDSNGNFFKTEAITVVPTSSGDFWVLIPNGLHLYSYLFSESLGFNNGNPVISDLDFPASLSETDYNHFGIKVSQRLNSNYSFSHYLCISSFDNPNSKNVIYSFNHSTGKITPNYRLNIYSINSYTPEFNRNSSVLFLGYNKLYAVDLLNSTSANPVFSQVYDFGANTIVGSIQMNKYYDIFFSIINRNYLGKINNPNNYGAGISVNLNYLNLGTNNTDQNLAKYGLPQLIMHRTFDSECKSDIILTTPEANTSYVYKSFNTIKTENNYQINPSSQNIVFKAGNSITLSPNTHIQAGAGFLAKIEECVNLRMQKEVNDSQKPIDIWLDNADKKELNNISIFPNPTSYILNIKSNAKINNFSIIDMSGRTMNVKLDGEKIDVKSLPSGTYIVNIETTQGFSSQKFIKK